MLTRKSVSAFAYGPGSTDILVTFEDAESGQLKNWPVENAKSLKAQYAKLDKDFAAAQLKLIEDFAARRAKLDNDAFALAEKAIAKAT